MKSVEVMNKVKQHEHRPQRKIERLKSLIKMQNQKLKDIKRMEMNRQLSYSRLGESLFLCTEFWIIPGRH